MNSLQNKPYICICLDDIKSQKSSRYIDLWMQYEYLLKGHDLPVIFLCPNPQSTCDAIKNKLNTNYLFKSDLNYEKIKNLGAYKIKSVFSKPKIIVYSYAYIIYKEKIVHQIKRFNEKTIENLIYRGILVSLETFFKKF